MRRYKTVSRKQAVHLIMDSLRPLESLMLPMEESLGYPVSRDIHASEDIPRFDRSAMDGYAVCSKDTATATDADPVRLPVVGEIHPSTAEPAPVERGRAAGIMTGGALPPGADAVVREEDVRREAGIIEVRQPVTASQYVSRKGKDISKGNLIAARGEVVSPAVLGIMASLQMTRVAVTRRPEVAILAIGNELIDLGDRSSGHKIVASNLYMLSALIRQHGGDVRHAKISRNDKGAIRKDLAEGLKSDILITTGGSSNSHSDLTRALIEEIGMDLKFAGVSMRPGKGTTFGLFDDKPVFALPGTPSAVFVVFFSLVLPALKRLAGALTYTTSYIEALLDEDIRKKPGVEHLVQGLVREEDSRCRVHPLGGSKQKVFSAMNRANGMIVVESHQSELKRGATVVVQLLDSSGTTLFPWEALPPRETPKPVPIVSIVGKSDAGKTTLLEKLVPELKARGFTIGTIKHDVHGFDIDHEGKDSWRHKQAGAHTVTIASPRKVGVIKDVKTEETLDGLASKYFHDVDIILTEGYKKQNKPKIEIFRPAVHDTPLCKNDESLVALVSDAPLDLGVPRLALNDIKGLADFVEKTFLTKPRR